MNSTPSIRSLALLGGGDAFIILTALFAVVMVKANFESSKKVKVHQQGKVEELKKQNKELNQKLQAASAKLDQLGIQLKGSPKGASTSSDGAIYLYVRSGGEIVAEKNGKARSVTEEGLPGALRQLGGSKIVLLAEPGVPSGTMTRLLGAAKGAVPGASTSLGTLKNR
jgi:hypothetical protein